MQARNGSDGDLPCAMRAWVLSGYGGQDKLKFHEDWPVPSPAEDEVLIKVGACAVNNLDMNVRTGWYSSNVTGPMTLEVIKHGLPMRDEDLATWSGDAVRFPRVQGSSIAGRIVAVGARVPKSRVGERVFVDPYVRDPALPRWARSMWFIGSEYDGGFADYVALPAKAVYKVSTELTDVELASFPVSYHCAEEMLERGRVRAGETVAVTGASGGVGSALIRLSKLRGATVIAIASKRKADLVLRLGADQVVARDGNDFASELSAAVATHGLDAVLDVTGGPTLTHLLHALPRAKRLIGGGALAGSRIEIDYRDIVYNDTTVIGQAMVEEQTTVNLVSYIDRGLLTPDVAATFPLERLLEAQIAFARKEFVGKLVMQIDSDQPAS